MRYLCIVFFVLVLVTCILASLDPGTEPRTADEPQAPQQIVAPPRLPIRVTGVNELRDNQGRPRTIIHTVHVPLTSTPADLEAAKAQWQADAEALIADGWRTVVWCEGARLGESKDGSFTTWASKSVLLKRVWYERAN